MKLELTPETYEQRQSKQIAALCKFAGAAEQLAKSHLFTDAEAREQLKVELNKLHVAMDWQALP